MDIKEEETEEKVCETCGKNVKNTLKEHNRLHHNPYKCDEAECGTIFEGYVKYKSHRRKHNQKVVQSGEKKQDIFVCEVCAKSFSHQGLLENHLKTHTPKFACTYCPEIYTTKRKLERHGKVHLPKKTKTNKFPCSICLAVLSSLFNLNRHKDKLHNKIVTSNSSFFLLAPGTFAKKRKKKNQTKGRKSDSDFDSDSSRSASDSSDRSSDSSRERKRKRKRRQNSCCPANGRQSKAVHEVPYGT